MSALYRARFSGCILSQQRGLGSSLEPPLRGLGSSLEPPLIVLSLSRAQLFSTPWTAARQASLSFTFSRSLLKLMSIESVMPSNHLILCLLVLLLPPIFLSIRVFSSESALCFRWPDYWSSIYKGTDPIYEGGTLLLIPTPPNTTTSGSWDFSIWILKRQKPSETSSSSLGYHSWWWAKLPSAPTILTECKSRGHFQNPKDFSSAWIIFPNVNQISHSKREFSLFKKC